MVNRPSTGECSPTVLHGEQQTDGLQKKSNHETHEKHEKKPKSGLAFFRVFRVFRGLFFILLP
jgi:hypothetical protein